MPACQPAIVLTTCPSQAEAERIGKLGVSNKFTAKKSRKPYATRL